MSLSLASSLSVPGQTAGVAHAAFPKEDRYVQRRDTLGTVYTHADFADVSPPGGHPAEALWRCAVVTMMPCAEHRTDRQAAQPAGAVPAEEQEADGSRE